MKIFFCVRRGKKAALALIANTPFCLEVFGCGVCPFYDRELLFLREPMIRMGIVPAFSEDDFPWLQQTAHVQQSPLLPSTRQR